MWYSRMIKYYQARKRRIISIHSQRYKSQNIHGMKGAVYKDPFALRLPLCGIRAKAITL